MNICLGHAYARIVKKNKAQTAFASQKHNAILALPLKIQSRELSLYYSGYLLTPQVNKIITDEKPNDDTAHFVLR